MFDITPFVSAVGGAAAGGALTYAILKLHELRQRLHALEAKAREADPKSKHDLAYLTRQNIGEATLFDLARLRDELDTMQTWLEYASRRAQHVAAGGSPDDPPTKWKQ